MVHGRESLHTGSSSDTYHETQTETASQTCMFDFTQLEDACIGEDGRWGISDSHVQPNADDPPRYFNLISSDTAILIYPAFTAHHHTNREGVIEVLFEDTYDSVQG